MARRSFKRSEPSRSYKKLYLISTEGSKTEKEYLNLFNSRGSIVRVKCLSSKDRSSPNHVLKRMRDYLKDERLRKEDEAWLVIDKDQWSDQQLNSLLSWTRAERNYHLAVSTPKFEFWLLLHFDDGQGVLSSGDCSRRLKRVLPGYDKGIQQSWFGQAEINRAVSRAQELDNPPTVSWPTTNGTTVYRLVEQLLEGRGN